MLLAAILVVLLALAAFYLMRRRQPLRKTEAGTAPSLLMYLPPDSPVIAYVDVAALRKLSNSPLSAVLGLTTLGRGRDKDYVDFVRDTGFDYSRDLDQAAIALWPTSLDPAANAAGNNPALAIANGRFDRARIEAYAIGVGGKPEQQANGKLYVVPGKPTIAFQFLSPTRIAIASGNTSADLLNLPSVVGKDSTMQARVGSVAGAPIFAVGRTKNLPSSFYSILGNSPRIEALVRSIQEISLAGQTDKDWIHVTVEGDCDTGRSAADISTVLIGFRFLGSLALGDPEARRQLGLTTSQVVFLRDVLKEAHVSHQDERVRVSFDLTPEMLGQAHPAH